MNNGFIKRQDYIDWLLSFKDKELIKVISGIRRSGKSTLFDLYTAWLLENGVEEQQIFRFNFENPEYRHLLEPYAFFDYLNPLLSKEKKNYIFLDEVQNIKEFEKTVDGFYINPNNDVYITGSNSYFLSGELATFLSGRYVELKMQPLSFREFVSSFSDAGNLPEKYSKYVSTSSFPYVLQLSDDKAIKDYLEGIYNTVLLKDIVNRKGISDISLLNDVASFVFDSVGSQISATNISNTLSSHGRRTSVHTIENYLEAMVSSYLCYKVPRYDTKGKRYLSTQPKYYAADIGLRNYLLGTRKMDRGHILENIVYLELRRRHREVYVGKINDLEIDFVTLDSGVETYYQVAYSILDDAVFEREVHPLEQLNNHYEKYLLTMDYEIVSNHNGIKIRNVLDWLMEGSN